MSDHIIISTTADTRAEAERIAGALIEQRLAACTHVGGPVSSLFHWEGKIHMREEWTCTAKTTSDRFDQVAAAIKELHSYDCPEIIATPIVAGSPPYLQWITDEVAGSGGKDNRA